MYNNYDYPYGADGPDAPWNQPEVPEKEFDVTCSQSLSRTANVYTNNYIPGCCGCDYEDGIAIGWQDPDDTSDTNWADEYKNNGYKTPLELIGMLREYLEKDLSNIQKDMLPNDRSYNATKARILRGLIEECDCWTNDETEYVIEN